MKTRIISLVLILAMLVSSLAAVVYSADETPNYPFTDVPGWAVSVVNTVYEKGIMNGTGPTTFGPDGSFTREQIAATLYRISGATDTATADDLAAVFTDADKVSTWAVSAVKWAFDNEVTTGITAGTALKFDPQGTLTREQAATMIMRFIDKMGISVSTDGTGSVKDIDKVSTWALDNVKSSIAAGIITGDQNGYFNPQGATNRISAAAMLARIPESDTGVIVPDYKRPSKDAKDPNPENIGITPSGGATFVEDIKISRAVILDDAGAGNEFTATDIGVHGWHESRIVRTEYGTYVVFAQDERFGESYPAAYEGYNAYVWGKFYLVKITSTGFKKVLEGEFPVHGGSCAPNVLAGEDGKIYVTTFSDDKATYFGSLINAGTPSAAFTAEAAFLGIYEFDTKTDTLVTSEIDVIPYAKIGISGYGYYQPIVDTACGKVYALYAGGMVPGHFCWFIYDIETGKWEDKSYIVEIDHRKAYFNAYPDGKGGIFFVAEGIPTTAAIEEAYGNVFKFASNGYLWHSLYIYTIPNMYEEKTNKVQTIYEPDYLDRRKFPEVGKKDGVPIIDIASACHYDGGATYLASNGYFYVIYKYSDPSATQYMYAIYDANNNFEVVKPNRPLQIMYSAANKIGSAGYQFTISESLDGDVYFTAINAKKLEAELEIYKFDLSASKPYVPMIVDSDGKAANIKIQYSGTSKNISHDRLSFTSTRNGSIQDNVVGILTYHPANSSNRTTTLKTEGFLSSNYGQAYCSGFETHELVYYSIQYPND